MTLTKFKRTVIDGKAISGLYESEICRIERTSDGWCAEVPMRRIGNSAYFEFRPLNLGGHWVRIGTFRIRAGAMHTAQQLKDGELVFDTAVSRNGIEPIRLVRFTAVQDSIRETQ